MARVRCLGKVVHGKRANRNLLNPFCFTVAYDSHRLLVVFGKLIRHGPGNNKMCILSLKCRERFEIKMVAVNIRDDNQVRRRYSPEHFAAAKGIDIDSLTVICKDNRTMKHRLNRERSFSRFYFVCGRTLRPVYKWNAKAND